MYRILHYTVLTACCKREKYQTYFYLSLKQSIYFFISKMLFLIVFNVVQIAKFYYHHLLSWILKMNVTYLAYGLSVGNSHWLSSFISNSLIWPFFSTTTTLRISYNVLLLVTNSWLKQIKALALYCWIHLLCGNSMLLISVFAKKPLWLK